MGKAGEDVTSSWGVNFIDTIRVALEVKNPPANAGDIRDVRSIPELGKSPGEGNGCPFYYSCLENPMDRGTRWATVHRVPKRQTQLK